MTYTIRNLVLLVLVSLLAISCSRDDFGKQAEGGSLRADAPTDRDDREPTVGDDDGLDQDVAVNNGAEAPPDYQPGFEFDSALGLDANSVLAFKAYRAMGDVNDNVVIAPLGLTRSFSIATLAASDASVQESILSIFEVDTDPGTLNQSVAQVIQDVQTNAGLDSLRLVPSIWAQNDARIQESFLSDIAFYHDMGIQLVDFGAIEARDQINTWFRNRTDGYIQDAVAPRAFSPDARFAFIDASYFVGRWVHAFDSEAGYDTTFAGAREGVLVRMMALNQSLRYFEDAESQAVVLPYDNGFSLVAVLPRDGAIENVESTLSQAWLDERLATTEVLPLEVAFPRVETQGRFDLAQQGDAIDLGSGARSPDAFANAGDSLLLGNILQRTSIRFEDTTTTAVQPDGDAAMGPTIEAGPDEPISVVFDRPFIFLVRDELTGAIVLIGRVAQPRAI